MTGAIQPFWFPLMLMAGLLALSSFFSGSETALFSLTPDTARQLRRSHRLKALFEVMKKDASEMLSALLLGNLIVNILFFCTGAAAASRAGQQSGGWAEAAAGLATLATVILFGEILPKAVGVNYPVLVLRFGAVPLMAWFHLTRPIRRLIRRVLGWMNLLAPAAEEETSLTPAELRELLHAVRHEPGFGSREKEIIEEMVILPDIRVREVMTPRVKVLRCRLDASRDHVLDAARRDRVPVVLVYQESDDHPAGYVRIRDLYFSAGHSLPPQLVQPLSYVPETRRVDSLLRDLLQRGTEVVAVVDEYGGLAGIVTADALPVELFGEPTDTEAEEIEKLDATTYRLHGHLPVREWRDLFSGFLPGPEIEAAAFDTIGGLVISLLGRMPHPGDSVSIRNLRLTVETLHHRRIGTVLLHLMSQEEELA